MKGWKWLNCRAGQADKCHLLQASPQLAQSMERYGAVLAKQDFSRTQLFFPLSHSFC